MADLSEYEQVRADNISRIEAFLASIGMDQTTTSIRVASQASRATSSSKRGVSKRKAPEAAVPARRSSRYVAIYMCVSLSLYLSIAVVLTLLSPPNTE